MSFKTLEESTKLDFRPSFHPQTPLFQPQIQTLLFTKWEIFIEFEYKLLNTQH
jgi:hypothetical protein